jgi:hypothetical protein
MNKFLNEKNFYKTTDFALATVISLFYPIEAIDKQNPRKAYFVFKRGDELDKLIEKYWKGELKVEPKMFFNQLRVIKARLYEPE